MLFIRNLWLIRRWKGNFIYKYYIVMGFGLVQHYRFPGIQNACCIKVSTGQLLLRGAKDFGIIKPFKPNPTNGKPRQFVPVVCLGENRVCCDREVKKNTSLCVPFYPCNRPRLETDPTLHVVIE